MKISNFLEYLVSGKDTMPTDRSRYTSKMSQINNKETNNEDVLDRSMYTSLMSKINNEKSKPKEA